MTIEEILAEFGVPAETIAAKKDSVAKWNGQFAEADTKAAAAQRALAEAQTLDQVVRDTIADNGITEQTVIQLRASNAAMQAALKQVKDAGMTGITIPDFNIAEPAKTDPVADLQKFIAGGFANLTQAANVSNRYQRIFGQPLPEDISTLAGEAAAHRMNLDVWAEQKYGFSAAEKKATAEAAAKRDAEISSKAVEDYKAAHPATAGHPELGAGVPSNYPNIPKPSDATGVREMAGKSPMEKIKMARDRVSAEVKSKMAAA
jgi:hypothetical protein